MSRRFARSDTAAVLLALLLGSSLLKSWALAQSAEGLDYYQFWVVGRAVVRGGAGDVYSDESRARLGGEFLRAAQEPGLGARQRLVARERAVLQTYSSPLLYGALGAITSGDYEVDYQVFQLLSLAAGAGALVGFARLLGCSWCVALATGVVFSDWFEPFLSDVRVGNVNRLQLGLLVLFLWLCRVRPAAGPRVLAGVTLAFAVLFKPNLAFAVPLLATSWLLGRRRTDIAAVGGGLVLGTVLAVVTTSAAFGSVGCWRRWLEAAAHLPDQTTPVSAGNFALARIVADAWGRGLSPLLGAALLLVALAALALRGRARPDDAVASAAVRVREDALVIALGCLTWLISAPLVWAHYLLLAAPGAILVLQPIGDGRGATRVLAAGATTALMLNPLRVVGISRSPWQMAIATVLGLGLLWVLVVRELWALGGTPEAARLARPEAAS